MKRGPRYIYVSYHKCATQYTLGLLRAVAEHFGLRSTTYDSRHTSVRGRHLKRTDFLMLTDYSSALLDLAAFDARGVYVIRDPRDILVSMYFSHRWSHPPSHEEIRRDRAALADLDITDGLGYLLAESQFFARITREMGDWDPEPGRFYETRFERLTTNPAREFAAMLEHLGLELDDAARSSILDEHRFDRLQRAWSNDNPGVEHNHYRRGVSGDWREHLTGAARDRFRARHGPLLVKLGYEADLDW